MRALLSVAVSVCVCVRALEETLNLYGTVRRRMMAQGEG